MLAVDGPTLDKEMFYGLLKMCGVAIPQSAR
jgi:hypothetical protein